MTWKVSIMDRLDFVGNIPLQYPVIIHNDHYIDLTGANWSTANQNWFDDDGDPIYCRRKGCGDRIPDHIMVSYKALINLMRAGDPDNGRWDTGSRHFFRRPATNG